MWPFLTDPPSFVQLVVLISSLIVGLSHILQPALWGEYFADLRARGRAGLVSKIIQVELWPALLIVSLHQVWAGPAIVVTVYGWLLLLKVTIGLTLPSLGMASMAIPEQAPRSFVPAGVLMLAIGAAAGAALFWPT
ncbi:hypothetical protein LJR016_003121 [Devosia sp. LjRoot16]|uniref:hypothetical protein n=1 Tax=Devosia sp. LjRoot16 TaxID=3342271 RepID=UPI003ED106BC